METLPWPARYLIWVVNALFFLVLLGLAYYLYDTFDPNDWSAHALVGVTVWGLASIARLFLVLFLAGLGRLYLYLTRKEG